MPCLTNLFPNGIVAVAELVKHESVQLGDIYLVLFIQHGLVCQYANDLTDDMMTVDLHLVLDDLTLQRQRELLYDRSVHLFAFHSSQTAALELVRHLVAAGNAEEVSGNKMGNICNTQSERTALFDVLRGLMTLVNV